MANKRSTCASQNLFSKRTYSKCGIVSVSMKSFPLYRSNSLDFLRQIVKFSYNFNFQHRIEYIPNPPSEGDSLSN